MYTTQWGRLRRFATFNAEEKRLAMIAVEQVRQWGGGVGASDLFAVVGCDGVAASR
jgi:hypothetical protein